MSARFIIAMWILWSQLRESMGVAAEEKFFWFILRSDWTVTESRDLQHLPEALS